MKRMLTATALAAVLVGSGMAIGKSSSERLGNIECESISLRSPDGRYSVSIMATNGAAGVWIEDNKTKELTAIYNTKHEGPVVAIHDGGDTRNGFTAALSVRGNKHASIQDSGDGKIRHVPLEKIALTK